jgi:cytochrome P450
MTDPREAEEFFLHMPAKLDDPFPDLAYFREHRPVFYYPPLQSWFVFRFDDVSALFHDARLSADRMKGFVDSAPSECRDSLRRIAPYLETWVLMKDGADHAQLRKTLNLGFNPAQVHDLAEPIQKAVEELLDTVRPRGRFDACGEFAFLLPAYVLSDFLGVPKEDRAKVVQWSVDFVDFFNVVPITVDTSRRLIDSGFAMMDYTRRLLRARRDRAEHDFLGTLVDAETRGERLTEDEIIGNTLLLLLAGHVAVRNLIGNVLYLLLTHPEQRAALTADPTLLRGAVEETLRFEPPVTMIPRVASEDFQWRGQLIRRGQVVQLSIASANRDGAHFADAERFDISRPPGKHLSFGIGPHGCLGATLAREQARIALTTVLRRMPGFRLDQSQPIRWYRNAGNRGPITLPLLF